MASVARGNSCVRAIGRRSSDAIDGGQGRNENESQCLVNRETVDWKHVSRRGNSLVRDADYASLIVLSLLIAVLGVTGFLTVTIPGSRLVSTTGEILEKAGDRGLNQKD